MAAGFAFLGLWALAAPAGFRTAVQAFPRNRLIGRALAVAALLWSAYLVKEMPLGGFDRFKSALYVIAPLAIFFTFRYMDELLAPRGFGGVLLLAATPALEAIRWNESAWRLVITTTIYVLIVWSMVIVLSPFRFRKTFEPFFRNGRERILGAIFMILAIALAFATVTAG